MVDHERRAEACREGNLGLDAETDLGACDLRGVAGNEVVDRVLGVEPGDRRQNTLRIASEQDDVLRVRLDHAFRHHVGDEIEGVGGAGIFGETVVVEIEPARGPVLDNVLEDGAETAGCVVNLGFVVGRQADDLGVAAALEVENAVVGPAVLVVTDELALGIGGERRLAGAGQTEEERCIAIVADVGRAVHGQHVLEGQQIVHHREHALFDLAAVARVADQGHAFGKIKDDGCLRPSAVDPRIDLEGGRSNHCKFRNVVLILLDRLRRDEHVACKERVPGELGDDPDRHPIVGVSAHVAILDEDLLVLQKCLHP